MAASTLRHCAFLTLEDRADFYIYDHLLFGPLEQRGWKTVEIPWSRPDVDWSAFDAVVIRSTWDYQNHLPEFMRTLERIEAVTRLLNPVAICRWNSHKRYLADLADEGVTIVPTRYCTSPDATALTEAFDEFAAERIVLKPAIGANADGAFVLERASESAWTDAFTEHHGVDVLVQPYLESIVEEGEYSLFYFGGQYSHAICKQPAVGDFRVQEEHGAQIHLIEAPSELRKVGATCLGAIPQTLLYSRIDLVRLATGELAVMEVELIEPSLYFDQDPDAAERFAQIFDEMMNENTD